MSPKCNGDAAAYVLGALEDHDVPGFVEHMNACAVCRDEVLSMQVVVDLLPATVPAVAAPPALKRRVMSVVRAEASHSRRATDVGRREQAAVARRPSAGARRPRWRQLPVFTGPLALIATAATAFVLLAGPLGGRSTQDGVVNPRLDGARVVTAQVSSDLATGRAALHESGSRTELVVSGMPPPPAMHIYQVWLSRPGQSEPAPTNAQFNVASDGSATVDVPGSLHGVSAVLVTTEPLGGSRVPSGEPIITAPLS